MHVVGEPLWRKSCLDRSIVRFARLFQDSSLARATTVLVCAWVL